MIEKKFMTCLKETLNALRVVFRNMIRITSQQKYPHRNTKIATKKMSTYFLKSAPMISLK